MFTDTNIVQPRRMLTMPVQVAPVDRQIVASALNGDGSVNPSQFNLGSILQGILPVVTGLLGSL